MTAQSRYPGCSRADILIGSHVWASCNAHTKNTGSDTISGWFFPGHIFPVYTSAQGMYQPLKRSTRRVLSRSWDVGPCADGYRIPTRAEWETALFYARQNNILLSWLLDLPYNGAYYGYYDAR